MNRSGDEQPRRRAGLPSAASARAIGSGGGTGRRTGLRDRAYAAWLLGSGSNGYRLMASRSTYARLRANDATERHCAASACASQAVPGASGSTVTAANGRLPASHHSAASTAGRDADSHQ